MAFVCYQKDLLPLFFTVFQIPSNATTALIIHLVYQKSTKKAVNPLERKGLAAFYISGRLPDVYQFNFFTPKQGIFMVSS